LHGFLIFCKGSLCVIANTATGYCVMQRKLQIVKLNLEFQCSCFLFALAISVYSTSFVFNLHCI